MGRFRQDWCGAAEELHLAGAWAVQCRTRYRQLRCCARRSLPAVLGWSEQRCRARRDARGHAGKPQSRDGVRKIYLARACARRQRQFDLRGRRLFLECTGRKCIWINDFFTTNALTMSMRAKSVAIALLLPLGLALSGNAALAQSGPPIPWDRALTVTRTSSEEDIKTVLRSLLQANGLSVIFTPDVEGPISFRLVKVPIASAFDQLIQQHNLAYTYNPNAKTVSVTTLAADAERVKSGAFVPLDQVTYEELTRAIANFGLTAQSLKYDPGTRTVAINGDTEHVQQIAELIKTLEASHQKQRERQNEERTREIQLKRAELTQQAYQELKNFEVKVIPLRFTDVGPTTKQFQGRTVTIPGIADTLMSILGIKPPQPGSLPPPVTAPSALPLDNGTGAAPDMLPPQEKFL